MYDLLTMNHEVVKGWSTLLLPTGGVGGAAGSSSGSPPPSPSIQCIDNRVQAQHGDTIHAIEPHIVRWGGVI